MFGLEPGLCGLLRGTLQLENGAKSAVRGEAKWRAFWTDLFYLQ